MRARRRVGVGAVALGLGLVGLVGLGAAARAEPAPAPVPTPAPVDPAEVVGSAAAAGAGAPVQPSAGTPSPAAAAAAEPERSSAPVVSDGPVAVTTRLSPDPSNVGDLLVFEVMAAHPRDVRVNLPTRLSFEPLHHVRTEEGEPEPTGDGLRKTFRIELQHFEVGEAQIPSFPLTYVDAEGGVHTVQIPARPFTVESLLVNEDDPKRRGEDPPISREYPDTTTELVLWSALGTLMAALVAWLVLRRLWGRERQVVLPPPIPPHEVAFGALDELQRGGLLDEGQVQAYYVELTEIAKGYLEGRFGVPALDRTTDEIRQSLLRDGGRLAPLSADEVVEFLQRCDLVKFARYEPAREDSEHALGEVRHMVETTVPREAPAKGEAKAGEAGEGEAPEASAQDPHRPEPERGDGRDTGGDR